MLTELTTKEEEMVFVFGSNLAGMHGAGAAHFAKAKRGAKMGIGIGLTGNAYAIPTKDHDIKTMPLTEIEPHVKAFIEFAKRYPTNVFRVTRIGCGLAGYTDQEIAPMFRGSPKNCVMPIEWQEFFGKDEYYYIAESNAHSKTKESNQKIPHSS